MNATPTSLSSNVEFELRVKQAILSAMYSTSQVAVLVIQFDSSSVDEISSNPQADSTLQNSILLKLRGSLRESDTVSSFGNQLIGVVLRSIQSPQDINHVVNRILTQLTEPIYTENLTLTVHPRIGLAVFPDHAETATGLLEYASKDLSANLASNSARNLYTPQSKGRVASRLWMSELRQAIVKDQLFLTFQPKVSLSQTRVTGVEVLVRWQHPEHGIILPDQFIPFAERTGLIVPMTLWVLQQALLQVRTWNDMHLNISVAVNLSMWNLEAQELAEQIEGLLRDTKAAPESLELEITETSIMNDPERVIRTLNKIRRLGVSFAIDDFGTGYSSFAYLTKLPVSCIKIDKTFVQNIEADSDSSVVVKSIIDLGHNLGLKIVAEGVETAQAIELLRSLQCDEVQGYYLCRPITAEMMTKYLLEPPGNVTDWQFAVREHWPAPGQPN